MKRWLGLVVMFLICLTGACAVVRRIGERQPQSSLALAFTTPEGSSCEPPCLLGMTPNKTEFAAAYAIIRNHPLTRETELLPQQSNGVVFVFSNKSAWVAIFKSSDGILKQSNLALHDITLGTVINTLGIPPYVNAGVGTTYIYYPSRGLVIFLVNQRAGAVAHLATSDQVYIIELFPADYSVFASLSKFATNWRGFTSSQRYTP